jgi:methionine-rich copper-binding protein CopC
MISQSWLVAILLLVAPGRALAHAHLKSEVPAVGSVLPAAPTAVSLVFTEAVEPQFSSIVVTNAAGERVDRNDLAAMGDGATLGIGLMKLTPGVYTVTWRVTAADTHKSRGMYRFKVAP